MSGAGPGGLPAPASLHTTPASFLAEARRGDVLVLANSTLVSHIIRYGTHRPFSHAGLMLDATTMRSAYPGHKVHDDDPEPPSVHDDDVHALFAGEYQRDGWHKFDGALLLRPDCTAAEVDAVVAASDGLVDTAVDFRMSDITRIAVMLLCQEGIESIDPGTSHEVADVQRRLRAGLLRFVLHQVERHAMPEDDPTRLVCSELVYRSFMNGRVDVPLPHPIVHLRRPGGHHLAPPDPAGGGAVGANLGELEDRSGGLPDLVVDLTRALPHPHGGVAQDTIVGLGVRTGKLSRILPDRPGAAASFGAATDEDRDLVSAFGLRWRAVDDFLVSVQQRRAQMDAIDAEFVTPADFTGSPRFTTAAAYMRVSWPHLEPVAPPSERPGDERGSSTGR